MKNFMIQPNEYLKQDIKAFYHGDHKDWRNTDVGYINTLKNDDGTFSDQKKEFGFTLSEAKNKLHNVLKTDLRIFTDCTSNKLTVCVVPRARAKYQPNQLLFKTTIGNVLDELGVFVDGTDYIIRHTDTPTTHKGGEKPKKPGITKNTCKIDNGVRDKNILLIDDLYTETVNIDEDAIQALLDNGANSVTFYAIGRTV